LSRIVGFIVRVLFVVLFETIVYVLLKI